MLPSSYPSQVCQPQCCASIPPLIKIILRKHTSHEPLHRSNAAPLGCWPENGRPDFPAVSLQPFQQDPKWPRCSCLQGTVITWGKCSPMLSSKLFALSGRVYMTPGAYFILSFTGTGDLCQVCAEPFLFSGSTKQQGICWTTVLEKCGCRMWDDWRLQ